MSACSITERKRETRKCRKRYRCNPTLLSSSLLFSSAINFSQLSLSLTPYLRFLSISSCVISSYLYYLFIYFSFRHDVVSYILFSGKKHLKNRRRCRFHIIRPIDKFNIINSFYQTVFFFLVVNYISLSTVIKLSSSKLTLNIYKLTQLFVPRMEPLQKSN